MEENKKLSSISHADNLEEIGEFWDTHDFTDYDDLEAPDIKFKILCTVPIEEAVNATWLIFLLVILTL